MLDRSRWPLSVLLLLTRFWNKGGKWVKNVGMQQIGKKLDWCLELVQWYTDQYRWFGSNPILNLRVSISMAWPSCYSLNILITISTRTCPNSKGLYLYPNTHIDFRHKRGPVDKTYCWKICFLDIGLIRLSSWIFQEISIFSKILNISGPGG